jgi:hypothetical protein
MKFGIKDKVEQLVETPKQAYMIALIALTIACVAILMAARSGKHGTR